MNCKQSVELEINVRNTVQRCDNYSSVLPIIQCDDIIYTAPCCKLITIVTVKVTVLYWRLCCQYSTVNFTIIFLQCRYCIGCNQSLYFFTFKQQKTLLFLCFIRVSYEFLIHFSAHRQGYINGLL